MKKIIIIIFLTAIQINCQTYLNIKYTTDPTYKYAAINDITEITFDAGGTEMTVTFTDASSSTEDLSTVVEMTYDDEILGGGSPLPVELTSFTADLNYSTGEVTLNWFTATEVDNYGFNVECKIDNSEWKTIGFVEGVGNSNSPKSYTFFDTPGIGYVVYYRLKQINTDGSFDYSDIVTVHLSIPFRYELSQNYPNPFNPVTTICFQLPQKQLTILKLYDALGKEVAVLVNEEKEAGNYSVKFNADNLSSGMYIVRITAGSFTKCIKMTLIK